MLKSIKERLFSSLPCNTEKGSIFLLLSTKNTYFCYFRTKNTYFMKYLTQMMFNIAEADPQTLDVNGSHLFKAILRARIPKVREKIASTRTFLLDAITWEARRYAVVNEVIKSIELSKVSKKLPLLQLRNIIKNAVFFCESLAI